MRSSESENQSVIGDGPTDICRSCVMCTIRGHWGGGDVCGRGENNTYQLSNKPRTHHLFIASYSVSVEKVSNLQARGGANGGYNREPIQTPRPSIKQHQCIHTDHCEYRASMMKRSISTLNSNSAAQQTIYQLNKIANTTT